MGFHSFVLCRFYGLFLRFFVWQMLKKQKTDMVPCHFVCCASERCACALSNPQMSALAICTKPLARQDTQQW